jgi:hypothetical protein
MTSETVPPVLGVDDDDDGVVELDEPHAAMTTAEVSTESTVSTEVLYACTRPPPRFDPARPAI